MSTNAFAWRHLVAWLRRNRLYWPTTFAIPTAATAVVYAFEPHTFLGGTIWLGGALGLLFGFALGHLDAEMETERLEVVKDELRRPIDRERAGST